MEMVKLRLFLIVFIGFFGSFAQGFAQFRPVYDVRNDYDRDLQQLSGQGMSNSWMIRPLYSIPDVKYNIQIPQIGVKGISGVTHVRQTSLFNSTIGYGPNLESIFPSKGHNSLLSVQSYTKVGRVSLQLEPELLYSQNVQSQTFPASYPDWLWSLLYTNYLNLIDAPEHYTNSSYLKLHPGNSALSVEYKNLQTSISTRSMWWGPAKRNSLLITNNAPGFFHFSFQNLKPFETKFGSFEFQAIWGRLVNSGIDPVPYRLFENLITMPFVPKSDDWRLIQGLIFTWQPKWSPGFYVGFGRTLITYSRNIKRVDHLFSSFRKLSYELPPADFGENPDLRDKFDDKFAMYVRYVAPKEMLEIYAEVGRSMRFGSWKDFMRKPEHTIAYSVGLNKMYDFIYDNTYWGIEAEFTQFDQQQTWRERNYPAWYTSYVVPHGHTNNGQILGSSIGPGSNSQYFALNFYSQRDKAGIFIERILYNNDLYYQLFTTSLYRHWADFNFGLSGNYSYGQFDFSGHLMRMHTLNYKYIELTTRPGFEYIGNDLWNWNLVLTVTYRL